MANVNDYTLTTHYEFKKPKPTSVVDIELINETLDDIDSALYNGAGNTINILKKVYPVGSIYISTEATSPATLFGFGTWTRIGGGRTLIDASTTYEAGSVGGAATVTLTAAQSGLVAHSHDLNSHKHSVPEHTHANTISFTVNSAGAHTHNIRSKDNTNYGPVPAHRIGWYAQKTTTNTGADPQVNTNTNALSSYGEIAVSAGAHTHTITKSGSVTAKAAFNTAAASGNTSAVSAANASAAHNNMPPYLAVYMWKRTA